MRPRQTTAPTAGTTIRGIKIMRPQILNLRFLFLLLFAASAFAQETLTNDDIIALSKGGVSDRVIIAKIDATANKFDTSTAALVKLDEADVSDTVVAAMIKKSAKAKAEMSDIPEQGTLADLKDKTTYYLAVADPKSRERIGKELDKAGFKSASSIETAGFSVEYEQWEEPEPNSSYNRKIGVLYVFTVIDSGGTVRRRNVYSLRKEKYYVFTAEPASQAASQFVKDLKKAIK